MLNLLNTRTYLTIDSADTIGLLFYFFWVLLQQIRGYNYGVILFANLGLHTIRVVVYFNDCIPKLRCQTYGLIIWLESAHSKLVLAGTKAATV